MADMGLTEVAAAVMQEVSAQVQSELKQKSVLIPLVKNYVAGPGMDTIKIPRAGGFTAADKAENTSLTAQVITFASDDLALNKHKAILARLEDIANLQAKPDVVGEILSRMASEMALAIDVDIVAQLELTSASAPDHRLAYADTVSLKQADILAARQLLHVQNVPFNECFIGVSAASEVSLLGIADFIRADAYGSASGLVNGQLGTLYGAKVVMSNVFDDAKTVIWHPSHVAFAMQQNMSLKVQDDLDNVAVKYMASQIYGSKVLDSGKRAVLLGSAT